MFHIVVLLVLTLQFSFLSGVPTASECEIDPFSEHAPLLIQNGGSSIIYPEYGVRKVRFQAGHVVELSCPQGKVLINKHAKATIVAATCVSDQTFRINGQTFKWNLIVCSADPVSTSRKVSGTCGTKGQSAEVGFNLDNKRFLRNMEICFDTEKQITLYSHFEMSSTIAIGSISTPRPYFYQDNEFYHLDGVDVNSLYVRNGQRETINGLLGLDANSMKYIQNGEYMYLARGHLTARADFVYAAEKNATFKYINAAPQWQSFNGGNWEQAESDTRSFANTHKARLQVWTGTYGVASLPHEKTGKDTELYLYTNSNKRAIPVPALYWKIVYNPVNKKGIVLIGVNNPYLENVHLGKYIICNDVSGSVNWLKWDKTNIARGYSYACTVPDFRKIVTYAPTLTVSGLLDK